MKGSIRAQIVVIGGGIGGLAAAIRLAAAGCDVTVCERSNSVGGKCASYRANGCQWDLAAGGLTSPQWLEGLWQAVGAKMSDDLSLRRMDENCRYFWDDGTVLHEDAAFWRRADVAAYLRQPLAWMRDRPALLCWHPWRDWQQWLATAGPGILRHLPGILDPRSLARVAAAYCPASRQLQQALAFDAVRHGWSPYAAPAALRLATARRARDGWWYAENGMDAVPLALLALARRLGVRVETGTEVTRLQENAGKWTVFHRATGGGPSSPHVCDGVVCNQDALDAIRSYLDPAAVPPRPLSFSGFVIHATVARRYPELAHHNVFFPDDDRSQYQSLCRDGLPAADPTVTLRISSKSCAHHAPDGCENWSVMVPAPPLGTQLDWSDIAGRYAERIFAGFARYGIEDPRPHLRGHWHINPVDFAAARWGLDGALHGSGMASLGSLLRRPGPASGRRGLVFAGAATYPGGGIHQVAVSGQLAARELLRQLGKPAIGLVLDAGGD